MMEHKGYLATIEYDDQAGIFHGEILNTRAVITFQGVSVEEMHREMAASIEDYLAWCAERAVGLAGPAAEDPAGRAEAPRRRRAG
jgi:predicted HicB family RNase H-like nuclease